MFIFSPLFLNGICSGLSTIFGKIALNSSNKILLYLSSYFCYITKDNLILFNNNNANYKEDEINSLLCYTTHNFIRLFFFVLMFLFSIISLNNFLKSLEKNNTAVVVIIGNSSNFFVTLLLSYLLFNEKFTKNLFIGSIFLLIGMFCVTLSQMPSTRKDQ